MKNPRKQNEEPYTEERMLERYALRGIVAELREVSGMYIPQLQLLSRARDIGITSDLLNKLMAELEEDGTLTPEGGIFYT
ncbi:hypothetical protein J4419_05055 [Candidatus Woesearchaeota archaeon]|nr:hypothetical protein [Candidatus Woesearchaeota archaeon]